ncbi:hypothetical protein K503DRAFT_864362 [Rhizopogon vinicolor AM-OR11-026]|uniref:G-protein coupled receptors family 1 profile domain-containing protein n=1 Tax=Rhizopogon vinicolor AM-OR11-026 TaxID=1314800 RepID=A0A1B7N7B2_9AGAM|nr:hypothetical protein K503DRAFT_864362 [Rhizopogon vinicolor AM-OR11-026]
MFGALFQNSFYVGNTFNGILYGVQLVLYFNTMRVYFERSSKYGPRDMFYMIFSTVSLFLNTIFVATQSILGQETWIINVSYPGGAAAYLVAHVSAWYQTMGSTASILLQLMTDGLLIYRCFIVWSGSRRVIIIPSVFWAVSFVFGILELVTSGSPNGEFFVGLAAHVGVVYFSATIVLNVITTCLICGRIMFYARRMQDQLGAEISKAYFTAVAIVIESALPYTLFGIAFLVSFGLQSDISILFLSLYSMFTCISPQMLILRVARQRAWDIETTQSKPMTTLDFATRSAAEPRSSAFENDN